MRVDPAVVRRKFDLEVSRLRRHEGLLGQWGCWVQEVAYPTVHLVFVPRHAAHLLLPVALGPKGQPEFQRVALPSIAGRAFGVTIGLDDFDLLPPSVTFVDPWTRAPIPYDQLFRGFLVTAPGQTANVLLQDHPITKLPFLCVRGTREYHTHPQHTGDDWMLYRSDVGLFSLVTSIWRTCVDTPQAMVMAMQPPQIAWSPTTGA